MLHFQDTRLPLRTKPKSWLQASAAVPSRQAGTAAPSGAIPPPSGAPDAHKGTLEEQITAMSHPDQPAEGEVEAEEDGSYLELLMQNAMSNLRRGVGDEPQLPPPDL